METRIGKWGNSLALRIPQGLAARAGLTFDSTVELTPGDGSSLVITLVKSPDTELDRLLAGVTEENLHGETDTGPSVGNEAW